jgi:phosphatidylinositol alpha-1,6-mannosyltransferase
MRVLIIARDFPPEVGGVQNLLARLSETFDPDQLMVLTRQSVGWWDHDASVPYRVVRIPAFANWPNFLSAFFRGIFLLVHSLRLSISFKPELVIAAYAKGDAPFAWLLKQLFSIPYVVFAYGMEMVRYKNKAAPFIRTWLCKADLVAAISPPVHKAVEEITSGKARVVTVPLGCGVSGDAPDPPLTAWGDADLAGRPLVLTVCRLTPRKGVDKTLEAVSLLVEKYPDLVYAIVGDGEDRQRLEGIAKEKGIEDNVIFAGRVSNENLLRFYARCDLLVLASREEGDDIEGFGLVFVEAGAFGKPVIGGDSGGIRQAVGHEENGLLVDPNSSPAIADAIDLILGDPEFGAMLGKEGRRRATEVFTWENCNRTLFKSLDLNRGQGPRARGQGTGVRGQ